MSVFVGACCLVYPSFGAELVATYSAVALVCTAASVFSKNKDVKAFTEGMTITCTMAAMGGGGSLAVSRRKSRLQEE